MKKQISLNPSATGYIVDIEVPDPVISHTVTEVTGGGTVNKPPIANAGTDKTITLPVNSITLDASNSVDPEGKIKTYIWRKASGPECLIKNPSLPITEVVNMREGIYQFELRVIDDKNLFSADTVFVNVKKEVVQPPVNQSPIAKAGNDQTITLPQNELLLDGSLSIDPDGQIKAYKWIKVSGPAATLEGDTTSLLSLKGLVEGTYVFRLTITDNSDASNSDEVTVTVKPAIIVNPPTSETIPFSFTKNTAWKPRNFAGYEAWNYQNYANFGAQYKDAYFRFTITDFRKGTSTALNTARFDQEIRKAITVGAKFSFGLMVVCDSDDFLSSETYGGARSRYPISWHNQMQAESVKDFTRNGMWIPNWNSPSLLKNLDDLHNELAAYINTASFNGVKYKDVINYSEIRLYAQWGEWHNGGLFDNMSQYPAGTRPTVATYKRLIDSNINAFPNWPLVVLFAAYDANWLPHTLTPPEVTDYVLKARNAWGLIGWRRDQWGATDNYVNDYLQNNSRSFGTSGTFSAIIMERWKFAPVVGEPMGPGSNLADIARQANFYRATSIGNGNYTGSDTTSQNQFKNAEKECGYYLSFLAGKVVKTTAFDFDISLTIENWGRACCYEYYDLVYELKNAAGQIAWTGISTWKPALKQPGNHQVEDKFKLPNIPSGTYTLTATFRSMSNYRQMPLFNNGQAADGSIVLATGIKY